MAGNKTKRKKSKKGNINDNNKEKKELVFKELGQEYGQVLKMLGNGRCDVYCFDGVQRLCHIRGKMRKKIWINSGDVVLIALREFQDKKADIILKYNTDETKSLRAYGELPDDLSLFHSIKEEKIGRVIFKD
mmetsp:Transcript_44432/g.69473  ORF Transcript_44432/g.69473 Transcript_44432/m.69473 type:complete len:132 (+) Transcript_44432:813-1208(+)